LLREALVDAGGESALERRFLRILREARIARPMTQRVFSDGSRTVARVDAFFPHGLVVEVAGHGTHAGRRHRQQDAQRHTELTARGLAVLTFTYEDVFDRPEWVVRHIVATLRLAA
jgi:very-short-patch-repair endonuclease